MSVLLVKYITKSPNASNIRNRYFSVEKQKFSISIGNYPVPSWGISVLEQMYTTLQFGPWN